MCYFTFTPKNCSENENNCKDETPSTGNSNVSMSFSKPELLLPVVSLRPLSGVIEVEVHTLDLISDDHMEWMIMVLFFIACF